MKMIFVVVGAAVGLLLVRVFMLDTIEEIGWRMFWNAIFKGNISTNGIGRVIESATFTKSVVGMAVGGILGLLAATKFATTKNSGK
ncbi:MAG: hypothetical protein ABI479_06805 [Gallionella sp.]